MFLVMNLKEKVMMIIPNTNLIHVFMMLGYLPIPIIGYSMSEMPKPILNIQGLITVSNQSNVLSLVMLMSL